MIVSKFENKTTHQIVSGFDEGVAFSLGPDMEICPAVLFIFYFHELFLLQEFRIKQRPILRFSVEVLHFRRLERE